MNQYTIISKYGKRTRQHKFKIIREEQWQPANRFAPDLNEREVIELVENATPGSMKQATKYGVKIFQGKNLKTFFWQLSIRVSQSYFIFEQRIFFDFLITFKLTVKDYVYFL